MTTVGYVMLWEVVSLMTADNGSVKQKEMCPCAYHKEIQDTGGKSPSAFLIMTLDGGDVYIHGLVS